MTRGPLFAAGADKEGQGTPRLARFMGWSWKSWDGRQVRAKIEQLRWQCFKEEQQMPILGFMWHRDGCVVCWKSVQNRVYVQPRQADKPERGGLE